MCSEPSVALRLVAFAISRICSNLNRKSYFLCFDEKPLRPLFSSQTFDENQPRHPAPIPFSPRVNPVPPALCVGQSRYQETRGMLSCYPPLRHRCTSTEDLYCATSACYDCCLPMLYAVRLRCTCAAHSSGWPGYLKKNQPTPLPLSHIRSRENRRPLQFATCLL